jgi:hypothetical protein
MKIWGIWKMNDRQKRVRKVLKKINYSKYLKFNDVNMMIFAIYLTGDITGKEYYDYLHQYSVKQYIEMRWDLNVKENND